MSSTATLITHACAQCGKQAALKCKGCVDAPDGKTIDGVIAIWYCGAECQKSHWSTHQPFCKNARLRRKIYRAGNLAQEVCYTFNRVTYMWFIDRMEKRGVQWILHSPKKLEGKTPLNSLPPWVTSEQEEKALVSYQRCVATLRHQYAFFKELIHPYCREIKEVRFKAKNRPLRLVGFISNGVYDARNDSHSILKVTVQNGEQYALDMTGAQFGWQEAVIPWNIYAHFRIQHIIETLDFGHEHVHLRGSATSWLSNADPMLVKFTERLWVATEEFQGKQLAFKKLLDLPEDVYRAKIATLLDGIRNHLEACRSWIIDRA